MSVLYVEDDPATREEVSFFLERSVKIFYTAKNGAEGLRLYKEHAPDLVITDIEMPVMDGLKMIESIKRLKRDVPVIVTTAYHENDYLLNAVNIGVDRYLLKPLNLRQLRAEMEELLKERADVTLYQSLDAAGTILAVNRIWLDHLGFKREEVVGRSFWDFIHSKDIEQTTKDFSYLKDYGLIDNVLFQLKRKDGTYAEAVLTGHSSYDVEGTFERTHCELKTIDAFMHSEEKVLMLLERERYLRGLITIHAQIGKAILQAQSVKLFLQDVTEVFVKDSVYEFAFIALLEGERRLEIVAQTAHDKLDIIKLLGKSFEIEDNDCPSCEAMRKKKMVIVDDIRKLPDFPVKSTYVKLGIDAMVALPLSVKTQTNCFGVLTLMFKDVHIFGMEELELFENISETVAIGLQAIEDRIEKERLIKVLDIQATTDALTGCANRHRGVIVSKEEVKRAHRYRRPLSIVYLDIDHFKPINDAYGHEQGDHVLIAVAESIRKAIRSSDEAVRWGGEEFLIILPESDLHSAVVLAEKVRMEIEQLRLLHSMRITASLGVTQLLENESWEAFIVRADDLMYKAKRNGRNQVFHA